MRNFSWKVTTSALWVREIVFISHFYNMSKERKSYVTFRQVVEPRFPPQRTIFREINGTHNVPRKSVFPYNKVCLRLRCAKRALAHLCSGVWVSGTTQEFSVVRNNVGQRSRENIAASHERKGIMLCSGDVRFRSELSFQNFLRKQRLGESNYVAIPLNSFLFCFRFCNRKWKPINVNKFPAKY